MTRARATRAAALALALAGTTGCQPADALLSPAAYSRPAPPAPPVIALPAPPGNGRFPMAPLPPRGKENRTSGERPAEKARKAVPVPVAPDPAAPAAAASRPEGPSVQAQAAAADPACASWQRARRPDLPVTAEPAPGGAAVTWWHDGDPGVRTWRIAVLPLHPDPLPPAAGAPGPIWTVHTPPKGCKAQQLTAAVTGLTPGRPYQALLAAEVAGHAGGAVPDTGSQVVQRGRSAAFVAR